MENRGNGNTVLLTVIGVATLLVALVGATFAYFTAQTNVSSEQSVKVTTANPAGLEYAGPTAVVIDKGNPGTYSDEQTFTITNPANSVKQMYDLDFVVDANEFVTTDAGAKQLLVSISSTDADKLSLGDFKDSVTVDVYSETNRETTSTTFTNAYDFTDSVTNPKNTRKTVVKDQLINTGTSAVVHTYKIKAYFVNLDANQIANANKTFVGHVELSRTQSVNS